MRKHGFNLLFVTAYILFALPSSAPAQEAWPPQAVGFDSTLNMLMEKPFSGLPKNDRATISVGENVRSEII